MILSLNKSFFDYNYMQIVHLPYVIHKGIDMKKRLLLSTCFILFLQTIIVAAPSTPSLKQIDSKKFGKDVSEPSGLYYDSDQDKFYTIDDAAPGHIFEVKTDGTVMNTFKVDGDMEAITGDKNNFYVAEEKKREIIQYDRKTMKRTKLFTFDIAKTSNKGIEGLSFNPSKKQFYIVNEKDPTKVIITDMKGKEIKSFTIDYFTDLSDIFYDSKNNCLWVLSDESKQIAKVDFNGKKIGIWNTGITQAEGVAVKNNKLYLVSDPDNMIYTFDLPK